MQAREITGPLRNSSYPPYFVFERTLIGVVLAVTCGAFGLQLAGTDTSIPIELQASSNLSGSLLIQFILGSGYALASFLILRSPNAIPVIARAWPIMLMPALAILSTTWSPDPFLTFRKSVAFSGLILWGLALAVRMPPTESLGLITRLLSFMMLLSFLWVFIFPKYAVHQVTDAFPYQSVHAGLWRGVYGHKTQLGYLAGLTFFLQVACGRFAIRNPLIRYGAISVTLVCLVGTLSGGGMVTAVALPGLIFIFGLISKSHPSVRLQMIVMLLCALAVASVFVPLLLAMLLDLLGKSPDLTGRTGYWIFVLQISPDFPLLGYGYVAGFFRIVGPRIMADTGVLLYGPHNGYLDVLIAFGYVGLMLCFFMLGWLIVGGVQLILRTPSQLAFVNSFPLVLVLYLMAESMVEGGLTPSGGAISGVFMGLSAGMIAQASAKRSKLGLHASFRPAVQRTVPR
jgi:O-antigen ligase